ncbi:hypothetical protein D9613_008158 [Agrocybe pediades]|uniref:Uncharacterized protein n=1 Tax=Agrocybe pediades TaxID=84607 RepID=A0A8H4QMN6_9AGAR|nr:hypothetical protein D9613_008158 [Agrocybe pediades]
MSLPQELFDMIIDEASRFPNKVERTRALIALALVSRAFRERAHDYLFTSVAFNNQKDTMDAIKRFLGLLEADPNSETIGVASRITSFECCIPLHATPTDPLVTVLKKLFIGNGRPASLSLQFICSRRWSSLAEDLAQELFEVCHRPQLASLSIYHLHDIPRNFLRNSFIKRLFLADVSVSDTQLPESLFAGMDDQGHSETGTLEFLHISVEKPILTLLTSSQQSGNSSAVFSHLKELRFFPPTSGEFDPGRNFDKILVGCKERLEILKISLGTETDPLTLLSFPKLPNLHTFDVTALTPSETSLSSLAMFLNQTECPNLHTIHLRFRISPRVLSLDDEEILPSLDGVGCKVLDDIFAQKKFNHVRKLTLRILCYHKSHYPALRTAGKCKTLILSRFPHIATCEHLTFLVDVTIF